jgi:phenylpyruvate tautomerase PptA (4-oxalocrotonate tautomerase family)
VRSRDALATSSDAILRARHLQLHPNHLGGIVTNRNNTDTLVCNPDGTASGNDPHERSEVMGQFKIYGHAEFISGNRQALSDAIHKSAVATFRLPQDKRFHRFFGMEAHDFVYPEGRSTSYTIVEVSMFEGRSVETKKAFIKALYREWETTLAQSVADLEIVIQESPRHNWGIRGQNGDELQLNYKVET